MLSKPEYGWTDVSIAGTLIGPASYLDDVPVMCLRSMISALTQQHDFCVSFDAEGWDFKVISDSIDTYVIFCKDEVSLQRFDIGKKALAEELYHDIASELDAWAQWNIEPDEGYRDELEDLLKDLWVIIDKKRWL